MSQPNETPLDFTKHQSVVTDDRRKSQFFGIVQNTFNSDSHRRLLEGNEPESNTSRRRTTLEQKDLLDAMHGQLDELLMNSERSASPEAALPQKSKKAAMMVA